MKWNFGCCWKMAKSIKIKLKETKYWMAYLVGVNLWKIFSFKELPRKYVHKNEEKASLIRLRFIIRTIHLFRGSWKMWVPPKMEGTSTTSTFIYRKINRRGWRGGHAKYGHIFNRKFLSLIVMPIIEGTLRDQGDSQNDFHSASGFISKLKQMQTPITSSVHS